MKKGLNFLLLIAVILFSFLPGMTQPLPPGSEYLGKGINLLNGELEPNQIMLLQQLHMNDVNSTPKGGGHSSAITEKWESVAEASKDFTLKLGLKAKYGGFSGSASMKFSKEEKEKTETKLVTITKELEVSTLNITTRTPALSTKFNNDLNNLQLSPKELFEFYGTHITLGVKVGGRASGFFSFSEHSNETIVNLEMAAKASYAGFSGTTEYNSEIKNFNKEIKMKSEWTFSGGVPLSQENLQNSQTLNNYSTWASSTTSNPGFFAFTSVKPIWELADNPSRQLELETAFKYMFTKKSLDNLQRFTNTSKPQKGIFSANLSVPDGYKILSGGAKCNYDGFVGNLLIGTYPADNNSQWVAYMMDKHEPSYAKLSVYVMAVYDPFDLLDVQIISKKDPEKKQTAEINSGSYNANGYVLVGGGSKVDYEWPGNMLIGSYPQIINNAGSWISKSIDHMIKGEAYISSYAIFLKFKENSPYKLESRLFEIQSVPSHTIKFNVSVGYGYHLVGGGAYTSASSGAVAWNFLTGTYPEDNKWFAESKDHVNPSLGILHVFAIGLKVIEK